MRVGIVRGGIGRTELALSLFDDGIGGLEVLETASAVKALGIGNVAPFSPCS